MLETKLATSVSNLLGVTPLLNILDKARKDLHRKEDCQNRYYQNKYKDTSVQKQVLAPHQKNTKKMETWEGEFVVKNSFAPTFGHFQSKVAIMTSYKKTKLSRKLLKQWKMTETLENLHEH